MLPGIAQIHVVANRDHQPPLVVIDSAPASLKAIVLPYLMCVQYLLARHLITIVQIENGVEDRILVVDLNDGPIRKHAAHARNEHRPLMCSVEVIAHEESAPQQKIPELGRLRVSKIPVSDFD